MASPKVSVIIPTFHDWDRLQLCLIALTSQDFPANDFEIIIANNDPADPAPDALDLPANARIIPASQPGSYAARNAALVEATGDLIAFTDSDCIPEDDWLSTAVQYMTDHEDVGVIAGAIHLFAQSDRANPVEICDRIFFLRQDQYAADGYAATANVITRKSIIDAIGPFDATLMSGGDKKWTMLAVERGYKLIYGPDIRIRHPARHRLQDMLGKARRVTGGVIAKKRATGRRFILPQFDRLIPPWRAAVRIGKTEDISTWDKIRTWLVFYRIRLTILSEQMRLALPGQEAKR